MVLTLLLCAFCVGLIYVYLVWNSNYWRERGVPGPKGYLLAGSFPRSFFQRRNIVYDVIEVYNKYRGQTPYIGFFASRTPVLLVLDPLVAKSILTTNFKNFHDNEFASTSDESTDPLLSQNPFLLTGEEWKEKRALITPAFTNTRLKTMYPIMQHVSKKLTTYLRKKLQSNPDGLDAKVLGGDFTADVVANCIYGIDSKSLSGEPSVMREMSNKLFDFSFGFIIYFAISQIVPAITKVFKYKFVAKHVEEFYEKLTHDAIQLRSNGTIKRDDFLNYLLQIREKNNLSERQMAAHTMTFFLDGFETSSYVIANVLRRLAENRAIQEKLRQEIEENVPAGEAISFEQINELPYLDQVFHESLRIDPIGAFNAKRCTENIELTDYKDKKVLIEKGMAVHIATYSIHHDPDYYPNPEVFDPDRFSSENGGLKSYRDKGVYLAFGDGPRICLGMRFGALQVKSAVVELVRNFVVTVNSKTRSPVVFDPANFLLAPLGGIWLDFEPIEHTHK